MAVRRIVVGALTASLLTFSACGDGHRVNAGDPTTTSASGDVAQPACVAEPDPTDYTADRTAGVAQARLQSDVEVVREYGAAHPDEFTSVAFDNYPKVVLLGYFTEHLDEHRSALRSRLKHPEEFDVRLGVQSERDEKAIGDAMTNDPNLRGLWYGIGSGSGNGTNTLSLNSTAAAVSAASYARSEWGDVVCIDIAGHPYPRGAWPDKSKCPDAELPADHIAGIEFVLVPEKSTLARGERGAGVGRITNTGAATINADTGSTLDASVVEPGTSRVVSGLSGSFADTGREVRVEPGQTTEVPIRFGTDDCRADADYSLPPGNYAASAYVKGLGRSNEAPLTITED